MKMNADEQLDELYAKAITVLMVQEATIYILLAGTVTSDIMLSQIQCAREAHLEFAKEEPIYANLLDTLMKGHPK